MSAYFNFRRIAIVLSSQSLGCVVLNDFKERPESGIGFIEEAPCRRLVKIQAIFAMHNID